MGAHNRDLIAAGHQPTGRAGVHDQTVAFYRLLDELRARHPNLEIESCSSGGARADLGVLKRTDRIWASDCIDPLERQHISRWTGLLVPPEMIGSHVGDPTSHSTGRTHTLQFSAGTALFGHFGIESDVSALDAHAFDELSRWVGLYKEWRKLLYTGTVVRADSATSTHWLHGVVSPDRRDALYAFVAMDTGIWSPPGRATFPGLERNAVYRMGAAL